MRVILVTLFYISLLASSAYADVQRFSIELATPTNINGNTTDRIFVFDSFTGAAQLCIRRKAQGQSETRTCEDLDFISKIDEGNEPRFSFRIAFSTTANARSGGSFYRYDAAADALLFCDVSRQECRSF